MRRSFGRGKVTGKEFAGKAAASGLGLGYLPVAPGTWASAGAAALYVGVRQLRGVPWEAVIGALFVLTVIAGLAVCPFAEAAYGRKDPRRFVLDEMAGFWLVCLGFRWRGAIATAIAAFIAFRLFDILKPYPIRRVERLPGGWGVIADDLVAAVYSVFALWLVCYDVLDRLIA